MKVCFVGAGSIGKRHIVNLYNIAKASNEQIEIHLIKRTNRPLESNISNCINRIVSNIDDLDEVYDAVFITNPTHMHYETVRQLNSKTQNFFIEKPVFDRLDVDISFMDDNKQYYVACPLRYTKVLLRAAEILKKEKVYSVRAISSSYLPNWRQGQDYRETYSAHKNQGGGVMIDIIHEWDYLCYIFGFPNEVKKLYGTYSNLEIDSEDLAVYIAQYDEMLVELHLDYLGRWTKRNFEVFTKDASYVFDIAQNRIIKNGEVIESFEENPNEKYIEEMRFFISIVRGEKRNTNNIIHALNVMKIAIEENN